ncbi:type II secretion system F family protein [Nocardioides limicola]|uniref:type II secretion system F family protein n=1 Tax=Nocardioides limicola TaxID=2803368 RepID=UPI00193C6F6F|nr:type II secretion system F family protein [Nocardioides sp. DJM-14]
MTTALIAGGLLGGALYLLAVAIAPPRRNLAVAVGRWEADRQRVRVMVDRGQERRPTARLVDRIVAEAARRGITFTRVRPDLELVGKTVEDHLAKKLAYAVVGFLVPGLFVAILAAGDIYLPWTIPTLACVGFGVAFFLLPDSRLKAEAGQLREDLRRALSTYLDLVTMAMASGRGITEALPTAARLGQGRAFGLIADTVLAARRRDLTPWEALADLGERTQMKELQDLGGALTLVAEDGAQVRSTLMARGATLRRRRVTELEAAAEKANDTMTLSGFVLAGAFLLFLIYPAIITFLAI